MIEDLFTPLDVLLTTRGQMPDDDPDGPGSLVAAEIARVPDVPAPEGMRFMGELERLKLGDLPGSLRGRLPDPLYVFSRGRAPERPLHLALLHESGQPLWVVSDRVKTVLAGLPLRHSEFFPVTMVYSAHAPTSERFGGGAVIAGTHWLWWCYATYALVDVAHTEAMLTPMTAPDQTRPGRPHTAYHHVGTARNGPKPRVALTHLPYGESAAFTILGWPNAGLVLSPALARALADAGLVDPDGPILIRPHPLDGPRFDRLVSVSSSYPRKPPLRVAGTDILAADRHDLPFHARRSPLYPRAPQDS